MFHVVTRAHQTKLFYNALFYKGLVVWHAPQDLSKPLIIYPSDPHPRGSLAPAEFPNVSVETNSHFVKYSTNAFDIKFQIVLLHGLLAPSLINSTSIGQIW